MRVDPGFQLTVPRGWNVVARYQDPETRRLLVHAATVPLLPDRGDYGSGVIGTLGSDDVFLALFEHGRDAVGTALFASRGLPRPRTFDFTPNAMQQVHPGMSGGQWFFTEAGRTWGLYAVLGSHARRQRGAVTVNTLLHGLHIR